MDWSERDISELESINPLRLNPNQLKFYNAMVKLASIGVIPSKKQLIFIHRLANSK